MKVRPIDANKLLRVLNSNFGHTGGAAVMKQLIEAQPTLTQPNNWNSVKDRLPEKNIPILTYGREEISVSVYRDGMFFAINDCGFYSLIIRPTHWKPLPEPPKED